MFEFLWVLNDDETGVRPAGANLPASARNESDVRARRLEEKLEGLLLVNMALWTFVRDTLGVTEQQLQERVRDLDLTDGKLDGKIRATVRSCPTCGRKVSTRHQRCLYCGANNAGASAYGRAQ